MKTFEVTDVFYISGVRSIKHKRVLHDPDWRCAVEVDADSAEHAVQEYHAMGELTSDEVCVRELGQKEFRRFDVLRDQVRLLEIK